jgi:hypothetical protein
VFVQLYHARALLTRGMHTGGIAYLLGCEDSLGRTHRGWWATQLANMYADAGFEASCLRWLEMAAGEPEFDSPLGLYTRACAFEGLRRWEEATELTRACIAAAGQWTRARSLLVHCLLTQGRLVTRMLRWKSPRPCSRSRWAASTPPGRCSSGSWLGGPRRTAWLGSGGPCVFCWSNWAAGTPPASWPAAKRRSWDYRPSPKRRPASRIVFCPCPW